MRMICSRTIPFIDSDTLTTSHAREALFRCDDNGFILYLSDGTASSQQDRVVRLQAREALIWLNETLQDQGSFWH